MPTASLVSESSISGREADRLVVKLRRAWRRKVRQSPANQIATAAGEDQPLAVVTEQGGRDIAVSAGWFLRTRWDAERRRLKRGGALKLFGCCSRMIEVNCYRFLRACAEAVQTSGYTGEVLSMSKTKKYPSKREEKGPARNIPRLTREGQRGAVAGQWLLRGYRGVIGFGHWVTLELLVAPRRPPLPHLDALSKLVPPKELRASSKSIRQVSQGGCPNYISTALLPSSFQCCGTSLLSSPEPFFPNATWYVCPRTKQNQGTATTSQLPPPKTHQLTP